MSKRNIRHNQRNPVARAAILRKGGVHEKCRASKRQQQKQELEDAVSAYYLSVDSSHAYNPEPDKPDKKNGKNPVLNSISSTTIQIKKATETVAFLILVSLYLTPKHGFSYPRK